MSGHAAVQTQTAAKPTFVSIASGVLQRQCACGQHTSAGSECDECKQKREGTLQRAAINSTPVHEVPPIVHEVLRSPGQLLGAETRAFMEPRFGHDFSHVPTRANGSAHTPAHLTIGAPHDDFEQKAELMAQQVMSQSATSTNTGYDFSGVRIYADNKAAESARSVNALAYTVGQAVVFGAGQYAPGTPKGQRLLAHELAHVAQQTSAATAYAQTLQRKVVLSGAEMQAKDRNVFLKARRWASKTVAQAVMDDMASADDAFDFKDEPELEAEIIKRTSTTQHMKESQETTEKVPGDKRSAFGYPFTSSSGLYGPRVNYAARDYWQPAPPDGYAIRKDKAKNDTLNKLPRGERCNIYGDQCAGYEFKLTAKGKADPYHSIAYLFAQQPPHKRTLIHCDYLLSLVNLMSFADSVGTAEFNKRVIAYGVDKISLRWNAFNDLQTEFFETVKVGGKDTSVRRTGLGSLTARRADERERFCYRRPCRLLQSFGL